MLSEIRKSIAAILYERTTSPLFGTLIISWLVINWKIVYLTFLIEEATIWPLSKIDFILKNYSDPVNVFYLPLGSCFALIVIIPLLSNGAYWLTQIYDQWRINKKNEIAGETLITQSQYAEIQKEIARKDNEYKTTLEARQQDVTRFKDQVDKFETEGRTFRIVSAVFGLHTKWNDVLSDIKNMRNNNTQVMVTPNAFKSGDPYVGALKQLVITYQDSTGSIKVVCANEGDVVAPGNDALDVVKGDASKDLDAKIEQSRKNALASSDDARKDASARVTGNTFIQKP